MKINPRIPATAALIAGLFAYPSQSQILSPLASSTGGIKRVLLISVDGMHALDFQNCAYGNSNIDGGAPYCPALASLAQNGVSYVNASTSKPSDSFPGSVALVTGATPRLSGVYYDVSYDRALSPPAKTTSAGIVGGPGLCPGTVGTQVGFDESIDVDSTRLDGGGGINPDYLPRDPKNGCAQVYPHTFLRANTIFELVKAAGGYTAWSDKHPAYDFYNGPSGTGVDDLGSPEINSAVIGLPYVPGCTSVVDKAADLSAWTNSFQNVQCYDSIKVQEVLNWIDGKYHDGTKPGPVPTLFGMNFQVVSVGQKLVENGTVGGYLDAQGTPTSSLLSEIQFVDNSVAKFVNELKSQGLYESTAIIITAKHGQSPIDPNQVLRITGDTKSNPNIQAPSSFLGSLVAGSSEDDVSLLWLTDQSKTAAAAQSLSTNLNQLGGGEVYSGKSIAMILGNPATDSRPPDILVTPNIGVIYTGGKKKISEHGGFSHDDTNVLLLISNPLLAPAVNTSSVETRQVAPTILRLLRINPRGLDAVRKDGATVLPSLVPVNPLIQ